VDTSILRHVRDSSLASKELALRVVSSYGGALEHMALPLRDDRDIVSKAVAQNALALAWASERLRADEAMVMQAVKKNGAALQWASDVLRRNEEVALLAIARDSIRLSTYSYRNRRFHARQELAATFVDRVPYQY